MQHELNWTSFYLMLGRVGPKMINGISVEMYDLIASLATQSDDFYSDKLCDEFSMSKDPEVAVRSGLDTWFENLKMTMIVVLPHYIAFQMSISEDSDPHEIYSKHIDKIMNMTLNPRPRLLNKLVKAACEPNDDDIGDNNIFEDEDPIPF